MPGLFLYLRRTFPDRKPVCPGGTKSRLRDASAATAVFAGGGGQTFPFRRRVRMQLCFFHIPSIQ